MNQQDKIKEIFKEFGKTQQQFAVYLNKDSGSVSRYLGKKTLSKEDLEHFSKFLGISVKAFKEKMKEQSSYSPDYVHSLQGQIEALKKTVELQEKQIQLWERLDKEKNKD